MKRFKKLPCDEPRRLANIFSYIYDETILDDGGEFQKRLRKSIHKNLNKEKCEIDTPVEEYLNFLKGP